MAKSPFSGWFFSTCRLAAVVIIIARVFITIAPVGHWWFADLFIDGGIVWACFFPEHFTIYRSIAGRSRLTSYQLFIGMLLCVQYARFSTLQFYGTYPAQALFCLMLANVGYGVLLVLGYVDDDDGRSIRAKREAGDAIKKLVAKVVAVHGVSGAPVPIPLPANVLLPIRRSRK